MPNPPHSQHPVPDTPPPSAATQGAAADVTELPSDSEEGIPKAIRRHAAEGFWAYDKSLEECDVTPEAFNAVKRETTTRGGRINRSPATPLKAVGGHPIQVLKIDDLRMFCSRNGIKGSRKAKKVAICWAICKAKEAHLAGELPPYRGLIPEMEDRDDVAVPSPPDATRVVGGAVAVHTRTAKKRRVAGAAGLDAPLDALLQRRLARSQESTNFAIQLRETVESAATLRREIRAERDRRAAVWRDLVRTVGDEDRATARAQAHRTARDARPCGDGDGDGDVKGACETLLESILEQDELVRRMTRQHDALSQTVDQLIPREK